MKALELTAEVCAKHKLLSLAGEDYCQIRIAEEAVTSCVNHADRDFNLRIFEKVERMSDLAEAMLTNPMFGGATAIIVRDAQFKANATDLMSFQNALNGIYPEAVLLLVNPTFLDPALKKRFTQVLADTPDAHDARQYLRAKRPKMTFATGAEEQLITRTNCDLVRLINEADKLFAYKEGAQINLCDVKELVAEDTETRLYELGNALLSRDLARALSLMADYEKKGEKSASILASLAKQYRTVAYAALSTASDEDLATALAVKPYAVLKARETARRHTPASLNRALRMLEESEFDFKSGRSSEETSLKTAVARLMVAQ